MIPKINSSRVCIHEEVTSKLVDQCGFQTFASAKEDRRFDCNNCLNHSGDMKIGMIRQG
jgi:hypothetical protein